MQGFSWLYRSLRKEDSSEGWKKGRQKKTSHHPIRYKTIRKVVLRFVKEVFAHHVVQSEREVTAQAMHLEFETKGCSQCCPDIIVVRLSRCCLARERRKDPPRLSLPVRRLGCKFRPQSVSGRTCSKSCLNAASSCLVCTHLLFPCIEF